MPASIYLFLILRIAVQFVSGSTIITYTDSDCLYPSLKLTGPNNGLCQQTLSGAGSFKVTYLDPGCVVTVYGVDAPYCDANDNWAIYYDHCYTNSSVNQFSIDGCITISNALSTSAFPSQPSESAGTLPSTSATAQPSSIASTGVKAGIGAGVGVGVIVLITIPIWILRRRRRQSAANILRRDETRPPDKPPVEICSDTIHDDFVRDGGELQGSKVDHQPNEKNYNLGSGALVELE